MRPGGFPVLWLMFFSSVVRCQGVNGPVVVYSRTVTDPPGYVAGMTVDGSGNAYLIGRIGSVFGGAFLTKVNATGKQWTVRLGSSGSDDATSVAVDPTGNVYVAGQTRSGDFPTLNAIQPRFGGGNCGSNGLPFACSDAFLVKLSPEGKITFSTFIGGTGEDVANGVAVDRDGYIYLTGRSGSDNFPVAASLQRSRRGKNDAFVMKLSASGNLVYSTYLGGSDEDWGQKLAVDDTGNAYVTGWTRSSDFPVPNAMQPALAGAADVFVAKLSPSGQLLYSTYLGGSADDQGRAIAVDRAGSVFLTGATESRDFPTRDPLQPVFRGGTPGPSANFGPTANTDAFVTKLDPAGAVVYSTFFGGSGAELATDITVDSSGRVYVTGITASADLALVNPVQPEFATTCKDQEKRFGYYVCTYASDAFVAALQSDGSKLLFSTYAECWWCDGLYSAQDSSGRVFVAGGYLFEGLGGPVFVAAIDFDAKPTIADNGVVNAASFLTGPVAPGEIVTIAGLGLGGFIPVHIPWDSGGPRISAAGARILIDGEPAPLMDVEANSVRAVVPYQVAGNSSAQLQVDSRGTLSDPVTLPVNAASPGVFTMNLASGVPGAGLDRGFVYNENGTQNSARDPASRGSTITFFATGEGQTDPPGVDGKIGSEVLPRPLLPVTVRIGGVDAEVSYAGGAPGFIAGLMEVHAKVPDAAAPGDAVPLQVNIGGAASQPGLGMSVR